MFINDTLNAENDQREYTHGVQPHDIPCISNKKTTEGIQQSERNTCRMRALRRFVQVICKRSGS